ncbi:lamin tail domain-containing protein [Candidatus Bipolaricaulota bacterium]
MKKVTWTAACVCIGLLAGGLICLGSDFVISEVAWAGTASSSSDEWIELHNSSEVEIDLAGWLLAYGDTLIPLGEVGEDTVEVRTTVLAAGEYLILERTNDDSVSDIVGDLLFKGALPNAGISIELRNPAGEIVDSVSLLESGWPAGTAGDGEPPYCTMERTHADEWTSNNGIVRNGLDADGNPLNGTPGQANSADVLAQWAPAVKLTFPDDTAGILSGIEMVTWIATDPNGTDSALSISVSISPSEEEGWTVLIENLANTGSFSWDTTAHPSGDEYRIQIRALDSEGYLGEATSSVFEIANGD